MLSQGLVHKALSPLFYGSGAYLRRWRRIAGKEPITAVVCYHRVVADDALTSDRFDIERGIDASTFEAQMRFLMAHFLPVNASEVLEPSEPRLRFAVTFDDGYEDSYSVAAPILRRLGLPGTFFVVGDYVGTDRLFWWEQLANMIRETESSRLELTRQTIDALGANPEDTRLAIGTWSEREAAFARLSYLFRRTQTEQVVECMEQTAQGAGVEIRQTGRDYPLMNWSQLKELAEQDFEIGCHTASHRCLAGASDSHLAVETHDCVDAMKSALDGPVDSFAYPYGGREYVDDGAVEAVGRCGVRVGFGGGLGIVTAGANPYRLPRLQLLRKQAFACAYRLQNAFNATPGLRATAGS